MPSPAFQRWVSRRSPRVSATTQGSRFNTGTATQRQPKSQIVLASAARVETRNCRFNWLSDLVKQGRQPMAATAVTLFHSVVDGAA